MECCNLWCSCVLTVCNVLQTVHSSKVMLAAEQKGNQHSALTAVGTSLAQG